MTKLFKKLKISERQYAISGLIAAAFINIALHIPSFFREQFKGDEHVFFALARQMGWDLSNFSTMGDPIISNWPNTIYRQPLFHHGPVFPYILKFGNLINEGPLFGLLFTNSIIILFFVHVWVLFKRLEIPGRIQAVSYLFIAVSPLIVFSTTRLHIDAISGLILACGLIAFIEAIEKKSPKWLIWASIAFSISLNLNFSSILILPIIPVLILFGYRSQKTFYSENETSKPAAHLSFFFQISWHYWAVSLLIMVLFGLHHHARLILTYGTIIPGQFIANDPGPWTEYLATRTRPRMFTNLLLTTPILLFLFFPSSWETIKHGLRAFSWPIIFLGTFLFFFLMKILFTYHEMRYFSSATPFFLCLFPWLLMHIRKKHFSFYYPFLILVFTSMSYASFREVFLRPNEVYKIIPPLYEVIPSLLQFW
ncbi:MAG: hypothetical protein C0623_12015 [Desulfuromonas sp.]|nr:MAG: hypothetical protein C0623_12015 [Desulfuromonas sp.]